MPYFTTLYSSSNVTTATPHLHNLRSSSLNIQDGKKHVSKSFPRGNYNHHSSTRTLTNISTTRQSHNFPTFFLSITRSMVNKLDKINATIVNNKSDVADITESELSTNITDDLIMIPGFRSICNDRPDNQCGGGLCTYIKETLDFIELNDLSDPVFETRWFLLKLYLPVYKSTFYSLKICPKNCPQLIHGSKAEIKKSSGQISIIIVSHGNKHPLLHSTSYGVFSLINLSSSS